MMRHGRWQERTLQETAAFFEADEAVRAVLVAGSLAREHGVLDAWSDVDLVVVLADGMMGRFFPGTAWLSALGDVYGLDQSAASWGGVTRVCFADSRRFDLIFIAESAFPAADTWASTPLWAGARALLSRSAAADAALAQAVSPPAFRPVSADQFERMVERFRFKGMLAVSKVVRTDLLIALHLALDLVRDCCVLGMMLRDRASGTAYHRAGGSGNLLVPRLEVTQQPYTALGILDSIAQSIIIFDDLARQWDPAYQDRQQPLLAWIDDARGAVIASQAD